MLLHFLRHPDVHARVRWPVTSRQDLHVQVHLPALLQSENSAVVELRLQVLRIGRHQVSTEIDVLEHALQLGRKRATTLRLFERE